MSTVATIKEITTKKIMIWIGNVSITMIFAGLTSAYIVRKEEGNWTEFNLPMAFWISTAIILISSVTINSAVQAAKKNDLAKVKTFTLLSLLLAVSFVISQYLGWTKLVSQGVYLVGNPSGSFMYVLTGLHVAHVLAGIICLIVVNVKANKQQYTTKNYLGLQICAIYWHFLDGLWVYLFLFLLLKR
jgi:cytochrome c oxidase subunit 3